MRRRQPSTIMLNIFAFAVLPLVALAQENRGPRVIEGPGYRIERSATPAPQAVSNAPTRTLGGAANNVPILCADGEILLLKDLQLAAGSSGVVAKRGCRLRIVDSDIRAGGIALIVEAGASVDVQNSRLVSRAGSVEAAPAARLAAWGTSFIGPATLNGAEFVDRGGNVWGSPR